MSGSQQLLLGETGGGATSAQFVEQVYSTFAYTGTGVAQTITNNIDLSTKGGLVWLKDRTAANDHGLFDTVRGAGYRIISNATDGQNFSLNYVSAFLTTGFSIGAPSSSTNTNGNKYISWSPAEQAKFFDIVTLNSSTNTYNHNLGSTPGCILVKCTDASGANWVVYHTSLPSPTSQLLRLNTSDTTVTVSAGSWAVSSTQFTVNSSLWANGTAGVAYLFANNAGGYGTLGTDSIVYCGVFSSTGQVNIGFEPQWIFTKATSISTSYTGDWRTFDVIRGIYAENDDAQLFPNTNGAENTSAYGTAFTVNATGFVVESQGYNGSPVVYVAIRRGPMAVPTVGTSVYSQVKYTGDGAANRAFTTGFPVDSNITKGLTGGGNSPCLGIRKTDGMGETNGTSNPYQNLNDWIGYDNNTQLVFPGVYQYNNNTSYEYLSQSFGRAPKFHDVQTWIGTGSNLSINHNLEIPPELIIIKNRSLSSSWVCYNKTIGNTRYMELQSTNASAVYPYWQGTTPTSTQFFVGTAGEINGSNNSMQAWMFATCPGVSMVGTYTGTGGAQTINCGFTTGARYVMIKRTDSSGGWCVFSTAMGMSSGSSPYYFMNSNVNYVTGIDYINTTAVGFNITSTAFTEVNGSGGNFIFLAIA